MITAKVDGGNDERNESAEARKQRMMNHRETQQPKWVAPQHSPVRNDQQETRTEQRGEEHEDGKIPYLVGIDLNFARSVKREHKCNQEPPPLQ